MIANQATEPEPNVVDATSYQVGLSLSKNHEIGNDPYSRAKISEEIKLLFLVLQAGWQDASKKGTAKAYSDAIANQYKQRYHEDLRKVKVDVTGWH